jgi:cytochrome c oxidase subunit 2
VIPVMLVTLTACSEGYFGLPVATTEQAHHVGNLWLGAWVASFVIGGIVWGLIGWAVIRYRRKAGDAPAPRQTAYHLPLELLYTLVPFLIVGVLFFYTVKAQDAMRDQTAEPEVTINVVGQKWSWTFNYMEEGNPDVGTNAFEVGTIEKIPDLYLPVNKRVRFNLDSADVIHSFWVPTFYFKLDVIPGHPNSFDATPTKLGTYDGKCAELCGEFHARMIFKVHIVTEEEYEAKVRELAESGNAGTRTVADAIQAVLPSAAPEEHK